MNKNPELTVTHPCLYLASHIDQLLLLGDHMIGHVYCKFTDEEDASDALQVMDGRYYDGRKMEVEFSPVLNFQEVRKITA